MKPQRALWHFILVCVPSALKKMLCGNFENELHNPRTCENHYFCSHLRKQNDFSISPVLGIMASTVCLICSESELACFKVLFFQSILKIKLGG